MPAIAAGTSGAFASSAIRAAPLCERGLCFLTRPFVLPRSVREHHDDIAFADELDRGGHRFDVALAAPYLERAARTDERPERPPEQLRLRHEPQVAPWKERDPERPGIEVRDVVGGKHKTAFLREILHTFGSQAEQPLDEWP